MKGLEWAVDYDRKSIKNKAEIAIRNSYIDSITEQVLGGKSKKNANGIREWDKKHQVPLRLTSIHLFATFLTPVNKEFHFASLINLLSRKCKDTTVKLSQKHRYKMIMQEMKTQSESW